MKAVWYREKSPCSTETENYPAKHQFDKESLQNIDDWRKSSYRLALKKPLVPSGTSNFRNSVTQNEETRQFPRTSRLVFRLRLKLTFFYDYSWSFINITLTLNPNDCRVFVLISNINSLNTKLGNHLKSLKPLDWDPSSWCQTKVVCFVFVFFFLFFFFF